MAKEGKKKELSRSNFVVPDILALKATGQRRKPLESDATAAVNWKTYGHWAAFRPLNHFRTHRSAVEYRKTSEGNADLKIIDSESAVAALAPGGEQHLWFLETAAKEGLIASANPKKFDGDYVVHLTDDALLAVPLRPWEYGKENLLACVEKDLIVYKRATIDGQPYAVLPHTAQLLSGAGPEKLADALRLGNLRAKQANEPVRVYSEISFAARRMSDPEGAPVQIFNAKNPIWLWMPDGPERPLRPSSELIPQIEDFFYLPEDRSRPIGNYYDHYVTRLSARREVVGQLIQWAAQGLSRGTRAVQVIGLRHCVPADPVEERDVRLIQLVGKPLEIDGTRVDKIGKTNIVRIDLGAVPLEDYIRSFDMEFNFGHRRHGQSVYEHADGVFCGPYDHNNHSARNDANGATYSINVAKTLDARYANVPSVLLNSGCYNDRVAAHYFHAKQGFTKNLIRRSVHDRPGRDKIIVKEGINHTADLCLDVINDTDSRNLAGALKKIFKSGQATYARLEPPHQFDPQITQKPEGEIMPEGMFVVCPLSSASSSFKPLNRDAKCFGRFIGEDGMALDWGGGNQYTLGEFYWGNLEAKGRCRIAISTHRIITEEGIGGRIPDKCHYWQLSRTISHRMMSMYTGITHQADNRRIFNGADFVTAFDGGDGTGQEVCLFLGLKKRVPEMMANRVLCFYLPPYSHMAPLMRAILGPRDYDRIIKDHDALRDEGLHLATSMDELKGYTRTYRNLKAERSRHAMYGALPSQRLLA